MRPDGAAGHEGAATVDRMTVKTTGEVLASGGGGLVLPRAVGLGVLWTAVLVMVSAVAYGVRAEGRLAALEAQSIGTRLRRTESVLCVLCEAAPNTARKAACVKICEVER